MYSPIFPPEKKFISGTLITRPWNYSKTAFPNPPQGKLTKFQIKLRNCREGKLGQKKGDQAFELCDNCRKASFINKVDALRKAAAQSTHGKSELFSSSWVVSNGCRDAKTKWTSSLQLVREHLRLRKLFTSAPGYLRGGARENSPFSFAQTLTPSHPSAEFPFFPL